MVIGEKIKSRRHEMNLTQGELAENICTQAMISKIELNLLTPSRTIIQKIAEKLEVPIEYFEANDSNIDNKTVEKTFERILKQINKNDYKIAYEIFDNNYQILSNLRDRNQIYKKKWVSATLDYYYLNKKDEALQTLTELVEKLHEMSIDLRLSIYSSLGSMYYDNNDFSKANSYFRESINIMNNNLTDEISYKVKVRIYYNYALNLESLKEYDKALEMTLNGIEILSSEQSMYSLGYLYQLKGYLFKKIGDLDETIEAYTTACEIFKILNYQKMYSIVKSHLIKTIEERSEKNEK